VKGKLRNIESERILELFRNLGSVVQAERKPTLLTNVLYAKNSL
jgi:hypothetical protein